MAKKPSAKNCLSCGTELDYEATKCHFCGNDPDEEPAPSESDFGIDPLNY